MEGSCCDKVNKRQKSDNKYIIKTLVVLSLYITIVLISFYYSVYS